MPALKLYKQKSYKNSYNKHLQDFNCLRKIAGKLILTNFPFKSETKEFVKFCHLTLCRD